MDIETAKECIHEIGDYNHFEPNHVADALNALSDDASVVVGREGSPVIYVWTADPKAAIDGFDCIGATWEEIGEAYAAESNVPTAAPPNELGGVPNADTYPIRVVGKRYDELETGVPTLIRAWWD